jgi:hypothetical protein
MINRRSLLPGAGQIAPKARAADDIRVQFSRRDRPRMSLHSCGLRRLVDSPAELLGF